MGYQSGDFAANISIHSDNTMKDQLEKSFKELISRIPEMENNIKKRWIHVDNNSGYFYNCNSSEISSGISELQSSAIKGAKNIIQDIKDIFAGNYDVDNIETIMNAPSSKEYISNCIKNKKKINASFTFDYNDTTILHNSIDIYSTDNDIIISTFSEDTTNIERFYIPKEFCKIYSPIDNIYFIIYECMKNINISIDNEYSQGWIDFYSNYNSNIEFKIKYIDPYNKEWCDGFIKVTSHVNDIDVFCCYNKHYKDINNDTLEHYLTAQTNFLKYLKSNEFQFEIIIYTDTYHRIEVGIIQCLININYRNEFNIEIYNENNIDICFVGNIDYQHISTTLTHYTQNTIERSIIYPLENRINLIEDNIIMPNTQYFCNMKEIRKQILEYYHSIDDEDEIIKKMKSDIKKMTNKMKKYNNYVNKHIKNNISTYTICLNKKDIQIPPEIWIKICNFINFKL